MNIRKNIDYSEMFEALDMLMTQRLPQMKLYCEIGKAVCRRTERGAAVMASEYLNKRYPDMKGFSPRSLRRMRDFYRTYENYPALLPLAMQIGWIHNVVIMEADLTMDLREWYIKAVKQFDWSKTELIDNIAAKAYDNISLDVEDKCDEIDNRNVSINNYRADISVFEKIFLNLIREYRKKYDSNMKRRCVIYFWDIFEALSCIRCVDMVKLYI